MNELYLMPQEIYQSPKYKSSIEHSRANLLPGNDHTYQDKRSEENSWIGPE